MNKAANILKEPPEKINDKIEKLLADQRSFEKEIKRLKQMLASKSAAESATQYKEINGIKVLAKKVDAENPEILRDMADKFRDNIKSGVILLASVVEATNKVLLISIVTKDLLKDFHAGNIVKKAAKIVGGGGGGRPDMAQAGGTKPENIHKALESVFETIKGN